MFEKREEKKFFLSTTVHVNAFIYADWEDRGYGKNW